MAQSLNWLTSALANVTFPPGAVLIVTDRNGTVLARMPDAGDWIGKTLPEAQVLDMLSEQREGGVFEADDAQGRRPALGARAADRRARPQCDDGNAESVRVRRYQPAPRPQSGRPRPRDDPRRDRRDAGRQVHPPARRCAGRRHEEARVGRARHARSRAGLQERARSPRPVVQLHGGNIAGAGARASRRGGKDPQGGSRARGHARPHGHREADPALAPAGGPARVRLRPICRPLHSGRRRGWRLFRLLPARQRRRRQPDRRCLRAWRRRRADHGRGAHDVHGGAPGRAERGTASLQAQRSPARRPRMRRVLHHRLLRDLRCADAHAELRQCRPSARAPAARIGDELHDARRRRTPARNRQGRRLRRTRR